MSAKRAAKKRRPVASAESFDELVNEICAFHGFRREKWDDNYARAWDAVMGTVNA